ncbi:hypothetical protein CRUP_015552 [Coryphaenoides rupestris]|nr:hypothetical protein CRUP_015552 [Coryphaenoides rupestris]
MGGGRGGGGGALPGSVGSPRVLDRSPLILEVSVSFAAASCRVVSPRALGRVCLVLDLDRDLLLCFFFFLSLSRPLVRSRSAPREEVEWE